MKVRNIIIITSKRVGKAIDAVASSCFALITGATATIAELPQITFPQEANIAKCKESPRTWPRKKLIRIVTNITNTILASKLQPVEKTACTLMLAPRKTISNSIIVFA